MPLILFVQFCLAEGSRRSVYLKGVILRLDILINTIILYIFFFDIKFAQNGYILAILWLF